MQLIFYYYGGIMYNYNILYNYVAEYEKYLSARMERLQHVLSVSPEGDMYCQRNGDYRAFVLQTSENGERKRRSVGGDIQMLRCYADKFYAKHVAAKTAKNLKAARYFLKQHSGLEESDIISALDRDILEYSSLVYKGQITDPKKWQSAPYRRGPDFEDPPTVPTIRGDMVRSKSESAIADELYKAGLFYKPEKPLILEDRRTHNDITYYPDFTILHPLSFEEIYWEHLGLMDQEDYAFRACKKLQIYCENGIIQGKNLIITMETAQTPFVARQAKQTIQALFNEVIW